ncbi:hypothetical protein HDU96_001488 [Phlyctochytrium bullatum]|nr:hypothetical protein HDU96_001488 [Phlyctochytrium bullatum]
MLLSVVALVLAPHVYAQGVLEPADRTFYLDIFFHLECVEQMSQEIPVAIQPWDGGRAVVNVTNVEVTNTNASIFMTVYPNRGLNGFTDADLNDLAEQLYNITERSSRDVFVRFAPEMNGNWFIYGYQPTQFVATWQRLARAIKARAPRVALVWAPNLSSGYPYGGPPAGTSTADITLLDTNRNGQIDVDDDPYTAYYPGDEYVDWVALSLYFKGTRATWPWRENAVVPPSNFVTQLITGGGEGGSDRYNFYEMFCTGRNKPMAIAESNAAFQVFNNGTNSAIAPGPGHLAIAQAYWQSYLSNPDFFTRFPKIKLINLFEYIKYEDENGVGILRDFRITNDSTIAQAFLSDMRSNGMLDRVLQAPGRPFGANALPTTVVATSTSSAAAATGASTTAQVTSSSSVTVTGTNPAAATTTSKNSAYTRTAPSWLEVIFLALFGAFFV